MRLNHEESNHLLEVDDSSGLPNGFRLTKHGRDFFIKVSTTLMIETGGGERRNPVGGLEYFDTQWSNSIKRIGEPFMSQDLQGVSWIIPILIGTANAQVVYSMNRNGPALSTKVIFHGNQDLIVRNLVADFKFELPESQWLSNIAGNGMRGNLPLSELASATGVSPMGGLRGSSGLIHLSPADQSQNLALWVDGDVEIPEVEVQGVSSSQINLKIKTEFCSDLKVASSIPISLMSIDLDVPNWEKFPPVFQYWLGERGVTSPARPPEWIKHSMIFEAQLGYSIFAKVNKYGPYPTATDLISDLPRIKRMGFTCIQLMPRQPYPSYNVHDYWDIDTSYGEKSEIKRLVEQAHKIGIRVILDVLLHGVLDKESITSAADGVRSGPYKDRVDETTYDSFSTDIKDPSNYYIAWSRHIIDFEEAWREGSAEVSPLIAQHPEWFYRDGNGNVTGVYTKAFDARSASWQEYFMDAMLFLVRELEIDGFRFDAPTYNDYPNWATWARGRANASALACVGLFQKLRPRVKDLNSDALMYTEPSGHLLRKSMDLNYNYDEQWLVTSLASPKVRSRHGIRSGKEIAVWMRDRDSLLPQGSMTAHHIDSHDTFWWPSWGIKWRREQFGLQMTQLLTCIFGSLPGPFMMFVGGEEGIESLLPKLALLKSSDSAKFGEVKWWDSSQTPDEIFGISYRNKGQAKTILVNPSDNEVRVPFEKWLIPFESENLVGDSFLESEAIVLHPNSAVLIDSKEGQ